jgi:hypothetical protein
VSFSYRSRLPRFRPVYDESLRNLAGSLRWLARYNPGRRNLAPPAPSGSYQFRTEDDTIHTVLSQAAHRELTCLDQVESASFKALLLFTSMKKFDLNRIFVDHPEQNHASYEWLNGLEPYLWRGSTIGSHFAQIGDFELMWISTELVRHNPTLHFSPDWPTERIEHFPSFCFHLL